jgi:hypothetical protein
MFSGSFLDTDSDGIGFVNPCPGHQLEDDAETQPELPFIDPLAPEILHAGNRHEIRAIPDEVVRRREVGRVCEIERLQAELHPQPPVEGEFAQYPEVPVEEAGPAQDVVTGIAEARSGDIRERGLIIVGP